MTNSQTNGALYPSNRRKGDADTAGIADTLEMRISRAVANLKNPHPDIQSLCRHPMDEGKTASRTERRRMTEWEKQDALDGFLIVILPSIAIVVAIFWAMVLSVEQDQAQAALDYKRRIIVAMNATTTDCPAAGAKIREIGADGNYSDREIEVVNALVLAEQAKPNGLHLCRAPSWQRVRNRWFPSEGYAR